MRVLGRARSQIHVPRVAEEISVLEHGLESAVLGVSPPGLGPSEGAFLGGLVLAVGRAGIAVADQALPIGVDRDIAAGVNAAIVGVELCIPVPPLKAVETVEPA